MVTSGEAVQGYSGKTLVLKCLNFLRKVMLTRFAAIFQNLKTNFSVVIVVNLV